MQLNLSDVGTFSISWVRLKRAVARSFVCSLSRVTAAPTTNKNILSCIAAAADNDLTALPIIARFDFGREIGARDER